MASVRTTSRLGFVIKTKYFETCGIRGNHLGLGLRIIQVGHSTCAVVFDDDPEMVGGAGISRVGISCVCVYGEQ